MLVTLAAMLGQIGLPGGGVALLRALLFVSVFVSIAMLAVGMLYRLWKHRNTPGLDRAKAARAGTIDGD